MRLGAVKNANTVKRQNLFVFFPERFTKRTSFKQLEKTYENVRFKRCYMKQLFEISVFKLFIKDV